MFLLLLQSVLLYILLFLVNESCVLGAITLPLFPSCSDFFQNSHSTLPPSIASLRSFVLYVSTIHLTTSEFNDNQDGKAAELLRAFNPIPIHFSHSSFDSWEDVFHKCVVEGTTDTLLVHIYRLGLIQTAQTLYRKNLLSKNEYLLARDTSGKNILHLAVIRRDTRLMSLIATILKGSIIELTESSDMNGITPIKEAHIQGNSSVITLLTLFYRIFLQSQLPEGHYISTDRQEPSQKPIQHISVMNHLT